MLTRNVSGRKDAKMDMKIMEPRWPKTPRYGRFMSGRLIKWTRSWWMAGTSKKGH